LDRPRQRGRFSSPKKISTFTGIFYEKSCLHSALKYFIIPLLRIPAYLIFCVLALMTEGVSHYLNLSDKFPFSFTDVSAYANPMRPMQHSRYRFINQSPVQSGATRKIAGSFLVFLRLSHCWYIFCLPAPGDISLPIKKKGEQHVLHRH
jgi:hypothetical protein